MLHLMTLASTTLKRAMALLVQQSPSITIPGSASGAGGGFVGVGVGMVHNASVKRARRTLPSSTMARPVILIIVTIVSRN